MPETEVLSRTRTLLSVDDSRPAEEGGPNARRGFNYQDEIAVNFFIEMLEDASLLKVHCESHDDIVLVRAQAGGRVAEFVQVKAGEPDKLWSVADLCALKNGRAGTSLFETSLLRDSHTEASLFRIVTLTRVVTALKVLTYPRNAPGREPDAITVVDLHTELERRFPGAKSAKENGADFWIQNCKWDERDSENAVRDHNLIRLLNLAIHEGKSLLPDQADQLLDELRTRAKTAGALKWQPDRDRKIITREDLRHWWETRMEEILTGASSPAGGKLAEKLEEAHLPPDIIALATDLRRHYSAAVRTSRYMNPAEEERLRFQIKSELISLRSQFLAGQIQGDGIAFHALCLAHLDSLNRTLSLSTDGEDRTAFIKGCMYDITDRCLLRFARPQQ